MWPKDGRLVEADLQLVELASTEAAEHGRVEFETFFDSLLDARA